MYDFAPNSLQFCTKFITISHQIHYDFAPNLLRFRTKFITISHQIHCNFAANQLQFCTKVKLKQNCDRLVNKFGAKL